MTWAMLPLSAKAVLPVIYSYANEKGQAWPSEITISALSGVSCNTVRKGINALLTLPGFSFDYQWTGRGRKSKKFKVPMVPVSNPFDADVPVFFFYKAVLTGGNWRMLKAIGKAVYPVLRTFSAWDEEEEEEEDSILDEAGYDYREAYKNRQWDYSEMAAADIARFAGIERARVYQALRDLEKNYLIEQVDGKIKVYLKPPSRWKRAFLNTQLMKSFGHKLREDDE